MNQSGKHQLPADISAGVYRKVQQVGGNLETLSSLRSLSTREHRHVDFSTVK